MEKLRGIICRELEKYEDSNTLSTAELEKVHMLTGTLKNIDKISDYSQGGWEARGNYGHGNSYGRHWVKGHYSRMADEMDHAMRDYSMSPEDRRHMERSRDILRNM